jgi:hypothetical protein
VSKTLPVGRNELFSKAVKWFEAQSKFNETTYVKPRSSETPKRSNWRCDFVDKSKFIATVEGIHQKSKLILTHTAIPTKEESDSWKTFWKSALDELVESTG